MKHNIEVRAASIISAETLANALSEESEEKKKEIGIHDLGMPDLIAALADAARGQKILKALGYDGAYYVKSYKGVDYVIIKGAPSLRPYLQGTRYLATNPAVVRVGIGPIAEASALKANFILAMTLYTATDIAALVAGDEMTLSKLLGNFIFNGVSTVAGTLVTTAIVSGITTFTAMAAPAILSGIVVGAAVSMLLNHTNEEMKISEKLAEFIEEIAASFSNHVIPENTPTCASCSLPLSIEEFPEFETCIKNRPAGAPGTGGGGEGGGGGGGGGGGDVDDSPGQDSENDYSYSESREPAFFDDDHGSYHDDDEDYTSAVDAYEGKGEDSEPGMVMGYKDSETGEWIVEPEGDGIWDVIIGTKSEGGSD